MTWKKKLCLMISLLLLLSGCAGTTVPVPAEETTVAPEPTTEQTMAWAETGETQPTETTEPSEETEAPFQLHCGIREDGTFDEGTLFIGDSQTYGLVTVYLKEHDLLGDAKYMAMPGAAVTVFFNGPKMRRGNSAFSPEFEGLIFSEAAAQAGADVTAVYFMLGTNHSKYASEETYVSIVEYLMEVCPNATVYLQTVPYATSSKVNYREANRRIQAAYEHFALENNRRVFLIDTQAAIGYQLNSGGVHLTSKGQESWYQGLLNFAKEQGIAQ